MAAAFQRKHSLIDLEHADKINRFRSGFGSSISDGCRSNELSNNERELFHSDVPRWNRFTWRHLADGVGAVAGPLESA